MLPPLDIGATAVAPSNAPNAPNALTPILNLTANPLKNDHIWLKQRKSGTRKKVHRRPPQRTYGHNPDGSAVFRRIHSRLRVMGHQLQKRGSNGKWSTIETYEPKHQIVHSSTIPHATPILLRRPKNPPILLRPKNPPITQRAINKRVKSLRRSQSNTRKKPLTITRTTTKGGKRITKKLSRRRRS